MSELMFRLAVTHCRPHWDECAAAALIGFQCSDLKVQSMDEARAITAFGGRRDVALVGMGGGRFDEHKKDVGRLPDECATTLVAKAYGLNLQREYSALLSEVKRADLRKDADGEESGQTRLELGEVIKSLHGWGRSVGFDDQKVLEFVRLVTLAHLSAMRGDPMVRPPTPTLNVDNPNLSFGSRDERKPMVSRIVVPAYPSLKELVKVYVVARYASRLWNANSLEVTYVSEQAELELYGSKSNVIFVGIEGGQFPPSMSASQTADYFGVNKHASGDDLLEWYRLSYVLKELDRYDSSDRVARPFELDQLVGLLNLYGKLPSGQVMRLVRSILDCYLASGREFWELCPQEFEANGGLLTSVEGVRLGMVETDLSKMNAWLRAKRGAQVVAVRRRTDDAVTHRKAGNTALFTADGYKGLMPYIAKQIVLAEAQHAGWSELRVAREGLLAAVDKIIADGRALDLPGPARHWHFFIEAGMLLNGSLSHASRPTPLSNQQLRQAIEEAIKAWRSDNPLPVKKTEPDTADGLSRDEDSPLPAEDTWEDDDTEEFADTPGESQVDSTDISGVLIGEA